VRDLYRRYVPLFGMLLLIVVAFLYVLFGGHNPGQAAVGLTHLALLAVLLVIGTVTVIFFEQGRQWRRKNILQKEDNDFKDILLQASPDAYVVVNMQGQVTHQQGAEKILGLDRITLLQDVLDGLQPASSEKLQQHVREAHARGEEFRIQVQARAQGRALAASGVRRIIASGSQPVVVVWLRDVTRLAEELQRQGENLSQAHTQLHELRGLMNGLPFPIWLREKDGRLAWVNETYARAVGLSAQDVLAQQVELERGALALAQSARDTGAAQSEQRYVVVDGQRRLLNMTTAPAGSGLVGYAVDVTNEAEMDSELKRHIKAHQDVLEQLGTPIAIYGADMRMKFYNRSYIKLWGTDEAFLQTEPSFSEVLDDLRERRRAPEQTDFQKYKKERTSLFTSLIEQREDLMHLPDGTTLRIVAVPHPFGGLMFVHEDVTDKLALESSYNTLIAVQRETLDNLAEGIAVYGSDGKLKLYNPAFMRIWNLPEEVLHTHPHISEVLEHTRPMLDTGVNWANFRKDAIAETLDRTTRAGRYECRDGVVIEYSGTPLPDGAVLISYLDVSDSVRAEKTLRESNAALAAADRLKSEFVANVSYQLRTPLNTIMGFAEILANQYFGALNERQLEYAHTMMEASKKLLHLINDVLDLATIEAGRMSLTRQPVLVKPLLESAIEMTREWARQQSLTVTLVCDERVGAFEVDEHRMKQVMFNLISNAIQYTPPGGHIRLAAERDGECIALHIDDDGMGIPEEDQRRVFEKFERANPKAKQSGAGLGLSLVKSFVELHGGHIILDSKAGKGTRITCMLPVKAPAEIG
jgi:signal transduction histidine kinase